MLRDRPARSGGREPARGGPSSTNLDARNRAPPRPDKLETFSWLFFLGTVDRFRRYHFQKLDSRLALAMNVSQSPIGGRRPRQSEPLHHGAAGQDPQEICRLDSPEHVVLDEDAPQRSLTEQDF